MSITWGQMKSIKKYDHFTLANHTNEKQIRNVEFYWVEIDKKVYRKFMSHKHYQTVKLKLNNNYKFRFQVPQSRNKNWS